MMFLIVEDQTEKELCKVKLSSADIGTLRDAIEDLYYFEFVIGMYQYTTFDALKILTIEEFFSVFCRHVPFNVMAVFCVP